MSDRMMSVPDAQSYLTAWSTGDSVDMWKVRAARTVVAQAEQIGRLQAAVNELSREMEGYRPHEVAWVELTHDDILKFEDMEARHE